MIFILVPKSPIQTDFVDLKKHKVENLKFGQL
jgi:hypothetical protein